MLSSVDVNPKCVLTPEEMELTLFAINMYVFMQKNVCIKFRTVDLERAYTGLEIGESISKMENVLQYFQV